MSRPTCCRRVRNSPLAACYKPAGIPVRELEAVVLSLDELEAIRLADLEGLYQEAAATAMGVSRPTFGRILAAAHHKIAKALVGGKLLQFIGGNIEMTNMRQFTCHVCNHQWEKECGTGCVECCPACASIEIERTDAECSHGEGHGHAHGEGHHHHHGEGESCCGRRRRAATS